MLTTTDKDRVSAAATAAGMSMSAYGRTAILAKLAGEIPLPATGAPLVGIYSDDDSDMQCKNATGHYPDIASHYFQASNYASLVSHCSGRVGRGTSELATLSFDGFFSGDNKGLAALAQGSSHPDYTTVSNAVNTYCDKLEELALLNPDVKVYAAVESEVDGKVYRYQSGGGNPSQPKVAATPAQAGQGINVFLDRVRTRAPHVHGGIWFAGYQKTIIDTILSQVTADGRCTWIAGDPYNNTAGSTTSMLLTWKNKWLDWIKANPNFARLGRPELGIAETGLSLANGEHTDAQTAAWIKPSASYTMRNTLKDAGVVFALWFDRSRDEDHEITDGSHPLACAAFGASLAAPVP
jgi:hypothetical protein